jgi:hypothetical protein
MSEPSKPAAPRRVQRTRPRIKGQPGMPAGAKYVGRGTPYGNPYRIVREGGLWIVRVDPADGVRGERVGDYQFEQQARRVAVEEYRAMFRTPGGAEQAEHFARMLHGRDLACWCALPEPGETDWCHAAVLLELSNAPAAPSDVEPRQDAQ